MSATSVFDENTVSASSDLREKIYIYLVWLGALVTLSFIPLGWFRLYVLPLLHLEAQRYHEVRGEITAAMVICSLPVAIFAFSILVASVFRRKAS